MGRGLASQLPLGDESVGSLNRRWKARTNSRAPLALISRVVRSAILAILVVVLGACGTSSPKPISSQLGSLLPTQALAPAPPPAVQDALLASAGVRFVPLTRDQLATVRITSAAAETRALAEPGNGYGPDDAHVVWKKYGCVFLGNYTAPLMPTHGQTFVARTFPAYIVQTLSDPIANYPMINIGVAVIDAETGKWDSGLGGGDAPSGIMGTTCGVTP